MLEAAGLQPVYSGEFPVVLNFPTGDDACKAFLAGGGSAQAIQQSGEEAVRQAIRKVLEGFRLETGDYRIENCFGL